jgi:GDP-4-dehydro-6-deoxy-D-mannose reductase
MRVLITGITGFVGSHLAEYLIGRSGMEVCGFFRWRSRMDNVRHLLPQVRLVETDLKDMTSVLRGLQEIRPDAIFHLAAQSFVPASFHSPAETFTINVLGTLNLLEGLRTLKLDPVVQIAGTGDEYGLVSNGELPVRETNALRPLSPYSVSKVAADYLGFQYHKSYQLPVVRTRAFNHIGPRGGEVFAASSFAKQIAEVELGLRPPVLDVGNLDAKRDFTDVRDIVKGYWLAIQKGVPGEVYNLASGRASAVKELLEILLNCASVKVEVRQDPSRMRPSDVPILVGDATKFRELTGWAPQIPIEQTLRDLLDFWRARVRQEPHGGLETPR